MKIKSSWDETTTVASTLISLAPARLTVTFPVFLPRLLLWLLRAELSSQLKGSWLVEGTKCKTFSIGCWQDGWARVQIWLITDLLSLPDKICDWISIFLFICPFWVFHWKRAESFKLEKNFKLTTFFKLAWFRCFGPMQKRPSAPMETHLVNTLWHWTHLTAVYTDDVFPVPPKSVATRLVATTTGTCGPMRRPEYIKNVSLTMNSKCMLPRRWLLLFLVGDLFFFYVLTQPCYGKLPILPSTDKTSETYPLQLLYGNTPNLHFFLDCFYCEQSKHSLHTEMKNRLFFYEKKNKEKHVLPFLLNSDKSLLR